MVYRFADAQDAVDRGYARNRNQVYEVANRREYRGANGELRRIVQLHNGYQWRWADEPGDWDAYPADGRQYFRGKQHRASRPVVAIFKNGATRKFGSIREAGRELGVHHTAIFYALKRGSVQLSTGASWRYADDEQ